MLEALYFRANFWIIGLCLLLVLALSSEIGFRLGRRRRELANQRRGQTTTMQAAILGLLGLLLAFTFSSSQSRFDTRRQLVVEEANAIGTTYLRAKMLPEPERHQTMELMRQYALARTPEPNEEAVERAIARSEELQKELWAQARAVAKEERNTAITLLFTRTLNETIDLHAKRVAAYLYRAPAGLLVLLQLTAVLAMIIMGYASGLENDRNLLPTFVMVALVGAVLVLILDLEQGQRGLIRISEQALGDVQEQIEQEVTSGGSRAGAP